MYYVYILYHTLYTCLIQFEVHNTICTVLLHPQTSETIIYSIEILCNVYVFVVSFIRRACKVQFMHHNNILVQEQL